MHATLSAVQESKKQFKKTAPGFFKRYDIHSRNKHSRAVVEDLNNQYLKEIRQIEDKDVEPLLKQLETKSQDEEPKYSQNNLSFRLRTTHLTGRLNYGQDNYNSARGQSVPNQRPFQINAK